MSFKAIKLALITSALLISNSLLAVCTNSIDLGNKALIDVNVESVEIAGVGNATLGAEHLAKIVRINNGPNDMTLTLGAIGPDVSRGYHATIIHEGTGRLFVSAGNGTRLTATNMLSKSEDGKVRLTSRYSVATIICVREGFCTIVGDLIPG